MHFTRTTTMVFVLLGLGGGAWAQAKAEPDYTLSYNIGAVTDYPIILEGKVRQVREVDGASW